MNKHNNVSHEELDGYAQASPKKDRKLFLEFLGRGVLPAILIVVVFGLVSKVYSSNFWFDESRVEYAVISHEKVVTSMSVKHVRDFTFEKSYWSPSTVTATIGMGQKTYFIHAGILFGETTVKEKMPASE